LPGATETVYALGLGKNLVGRSFNCDFPAPVEELPICYKAEIVQIEEEENLQKTTEQILQDALSWFALDFEQIKALQPSHIITQSRAIECGLKTSEVQELLQDFLQNKELKLIDLNPQNFDHAMADFVKLAAGLGKFNTGFVLRAALNKEILNINMKANMLGQKPKVAILEWVEPLMVAGLWIPGLLELAAAKNVFPLEENRHKIEFEDLLAKDPEILIISPCGIKLDHIREEVEEALQQEEWQQLQAVKNNKVFLMDGQSYLYRPGPRLLDSLEILTEILHPDHFEAKHLNTAWVRL
jgi:iron complex transport system substrate-binding protein